MALETYTIEMFPSEAVKRCSKCGEAKALGEFHKSRRNSDGCQSHCKECHSLWRSANRDRIAEKSKQYYLENREEILVRTASRYINNIEHKREKGRIYYWQNRSRLLEKQKQYYAENREYVCTLRKQSRRRYYSSNRERLKEKSRIYYRNNRELILEKKRRTYAVNPAKANKATLRWRHAHPEMALAAWANRRARKRNAKGTHTAQEMREQFTRQKGICYYCDYKLVHPFEPRPKFTTKRTAHWEHIIPLVRGGRNDLSNLVWTCAKCNLSKGAKLLGIEWKAPNGRLI